LRGLLSPDDYLTDVVRESLLSDGAFGRTYKGVWKGKQVTVKKFNRVIPPDHIEGNFKEKFMDQVKPAVSFYRELVQWKMVSRFSSVWPLLGFTMWLDRDEMTVVFALVSPLAEGHLKLNYFEWYTLKPKEFANYFHDAAVGLESLHGHDVIHGDIRPENILQNKGRCYLVGFGISKIVDGSSSFSFAPALAQAQRLPKLLDGSVTRRDKNTDIFSFGSTMYQVLARETPDMATGCPERPKPRIGQEWDAIWNLVERCMSEYPTDRPTAIELVESLKAM